MAGLLAGERNRRRVTARRTRHASSAGFGHRANRIGRHTPTGRLETWFDGCRDEVVRRSGERGGWSVPVDGWDFSWLKGHATEQRPSWGYQRLLGEKLGAATAALDIQTGGGEVLAGAVPRLPPTMAATEGWPPNVTKATALLHPRGAVVVADAEEPPLPFADGAFDLVISRHPVTVGLGGDRPGARRPAARTSRNRSAAEATWRSASTSCGPRRSLADSGRTAARPSRRGRPGSTSSTAAPSACAMEFRDVGPVVYYLRKVIWIVPDFTVDRYRRRLREAPRPDRA